MKYIFLFIFYFNFLMAYSQNSQECIIEKALGLNMLHLRQSLNSQSLSITAQSIYKIRKRELLPIKTSYVSDNILNDSLKIKNSLCFFNIDNGVVSSIIFEAANPHQLTAHLIQILGNFTNQTRFNLGASSHETKGWVTDTFCLMLLKTNLTILVIYYDCNNNKIIELPTTLHWQYGG